MRRPQEREPRNLHSDSVFGRTPGTMSEKNKTKGDEPEAGASSGPESASKASENESHEDPGAETTAVAEVEVEAPPKKKESKKPLKVESGGTSGGGRVEFDENSENGLLINDKYLPEELLSEILFNADEKTLLNCQLVCKRWYSILRSYVWRKKAEAVMGRPLHFNKPMPWLFYYAICSKKAFGKNLLKNHSGKDGKSKYWKVIANGGNRWAVESPPVGVQALPSLEPVFEGQEHCFVTSFGECSKEQIVDLVAEGLVPQLLDEVQPSIMVSEWYSCRWDCPATYECSAKLINQDGTEMDDFHFRDILVGEKQDVWHYVEHEFTDYGPGLRKVRFYHGGKDRSFWAGHYGSKMAGACVKVNLPKQAPTESRGQQDPPMDL